MLSLYPPIAVMLAAIAVSFGAGMVRGFAGFGFSAVCVAGLSLFVAPSVLVLAVLSLEVLASLSLLRSSLPAVDRNWLGWLVLGSVLCTPLGILALANLPDTLLRLTVGLALLIAASLLRISLGTRFSPTPQFRAGTGMLGGVLNGLAASGGIAVAMLMAAAGMMAAPLRATMIVYLLFAGVYALATAAVLSNTGSTALLSADTLRWILLLGPPMFVGIWVGRRSFAVADPVVYRRLVLNLIMLISALTSARAAWQLLATA